MLFERQKRLLALVDALGGEIGGLDFQKLLFLFCVEEEKAPSYEFVPYRFGGFSFTSYADKRRLIERGLLADEERTWKLTASGIELAKVDWRVRMNMDQFAKTYQGVRGEALVSEAYRRYPYYATRSEMAERLLKDDRKALDAIEEKRPEEKGPGLCTIGYEGRTLEDFLNRLFQNSVTLLCDVRRNPLSRKYGFSKGTLSNACKSLDIRYEHIPELGIESKVRQSLNCQADYDALFDAYESESLPQQTSALAKIQHWIDDGQRVALTCFEKLPQQCHRHCVAEAVAKEFGNNFITVDL